MMVLRYDGSLSKHMTGPFGEKLLYVPYQEESLNNGDHESGYGYLGKHKKISESSIDLEPMQMGARVYIPILGRFLQVDPVEGGCLNNYVYAMDPVNQKDLSGKWSFGSLLSKVFNHAASFVRGFMRPQSRTKRRPRAIRPNFARQYGMWLSGRYRGRTIGIDIRNTNWILQNKSIRNLKSGTKRLSDNVRVGGSCTGSCYLAIGRGSGRFIGTVEKRRVFGGLYHYKIHGGIILKDNMYNFELASWASPGNVPAHIGGLASRVLNGVAPGDYNMTFVGIGNVNMEGYIWQ